MVQLGPGAVRVNPFPNCRERTFIGVQFIQRVSQRAMESTASFSFADWLPSRYKMKTSYHSDASIPHRSSPFRLACLPHSSIPRTGLDDQLREANDPILSRRRILRRQILSVQRSRHFRAGPGNRTARCKHHLQRPQSPTRLQSLWNVFLRPATCFTRRVQSEPQLSTACWRDSRISFQPEYSLGLTDCSPRLAEAQIRLRARSFSDQHGNHVRPDDRA